MFSKNSRKQFKYVLDEKMCNFERFLDSSNCVNISQCYLEFNDSYEHRVRVVKYRDSIKYFYTVQKKCKNGISYVVYDKLIDENTYKMLISTKNVKNRVSKIRYYFTYDEVKFHLDIFEDGKIILESTDNNFDQSCFNVVLDVTANSHYLNVNYVSEVKQLKNILHMEVY